jgi:sortase A
MNAVDAHATVAPRASGARTAAHLLGNVLLGIALGLLAYYGITDVMADSAQSALRRELSQLGVVAEPLPPVEEDGAAERVLDFEGWEEDVAYWESLQEGGVFGRLVIDSVEADTIVVKGTDTADLRRGPGWITTTDVPGPTGNCGISGHRTTYGAPFGRLGEIETGDELVFYSPTRRCTYEAVEQRVVRPWELDVIATTEEPMLTLTACHPPYSAAYRLIVHGRLVDVRRLEG